jgi:hypothetical protein
VNSAIINTGVLISLSHTNISSFGIYPIVELLYHMLVLHLILYRDNIIFSVMAVLIYIVNKSVNLEFHLFTSSLTSDIFYLFDNSGS